jgi:DNA topoisomerase I
MKNLVIVESPAKAKTIGKYLGDEYEVISSKGHIRDLSKKFKGRYGVDIDNGFLPDYQVIKEKKVVVSDLVKRVKKAQKVYLASDPDREGEAIAWHLADELKLNTQEANRVVFNEITKTTILNAIANPRMIDDCLVKSQETRRILDRIIGFDLSKVCQKKVRSKSAGRVQSVALKLIVDREKEIEAFNRQEFWTIEATLDTSPSIVAKLSKIDGKNIVDRIDDKTDFNKRVLIGNQLDAQQIVEQIGQLTLSQIKQSMTNRNPKDPLITSTLQQDANSKFNFSAKKTMNIAQKLYEGIVINGNQIGLISYMRTDSKRLSDQFMAQTKEFIIDNYGQEYSGFYHFKSNDQAQDAHEAIRPTSIQLTPQSIRSQLTNDEYRIYSLIYARAIACQMAPAKFASTSLTLEDGKFLFTVSGSIMKFDGYLKVMGEFDNSKDEILPEMIEGQVFSPTKVTPIQHFSEPPARYNEARLIKEMEERGIGRPSTYATIISTLEKRIYVELKSNSEKGKNKLFFPTKQGRITADFLENNFSSFINVEYTQQMEDALDGIASCGIDRLTVLQPAKAKIDELIALVADVVPLPLEKTGEHCPNCGADLVIRVGRFGQFKSCSTYPECKYTAPLKPKAESKIIGRDCPRCHHPLVERKNRRNHNTFIACSNYPNCEYLEPSKKENTKKQASGEQSD